MSAIARAQRSKDADLRRRSSTGHRDARPNQQPVHQTDPQSIPSAPVILRNEVPFVKKHAPASDPDAAGAAGSSPAALSRSIFIAN